MIRHTFSLLDGIGEKLEKRLWRSGILTWDDFLASGEVDFLSSERKRLLDSALSSALSELDRGNSLYFADNLRSREHWRLFETFRGEAVCLDIETNGRMPWAGGYITVVGLYDGFDYRVLVRGDGLSPERLADELSAYKYLITFYGSAFDVPFLERSVPGLRVGIPHFDLCFGARKLGLKGGLKKIERTMGIAREESVRGMDGYDAVLLWERARRGSDEALELLVAYNREDTVNLMGIAEAVYSGLRGATGIEEFERGGGGEVARCG
ncbi:MAG: ribonuclease H-like domain-containing protein [Thermodesulfovibrionales bacterium]